MQEPRRRPLWLVGALTVLSFGAYIPIWFGLSWAELKRETEGGDASPLARGTGDGGMSPLGHALSIFVPVYGLWQAYRHFTLIDAFRRKVDPDHGVDALTGAIGTGIWWLTFTHYSTEPIFVALDAIELAAGTAVIVYGQHALNGYWRSRPGPPVEERITQLDWLAIGIAVSWALITLIGIVAPAT
jgi:hypothetical protein